MILQSWLFVSISALLIQCSTSSLTCESKWEEQSEVLCTCKRDSERIVSTVSWYIYVHETQITVICRKSDLFNGCGYQGLFHSTIGDHSSNLTIVAVNRSMTEVVCVFDSSGGPQDAASESFNLPVFVKPVKLHCLPMAYHISSLTGEVNVYAILICECKEIYPKGICRYNVRGSLSSVLDKFSNITYRHQFSEQTGLYATTCGFGVRLSHEDLLQHATDPSAASQFQVEIYPDVKVISNFTAVSNWTAPFVYVPSNITRFYANLGTNILTVDRGEYVKLLCEASGSPLPTLAIVKKNTGMKVEEKLNASTLEYIKESVDCKDQGRYVCQLEHDIGNSREVELKVRGSMEFPRPTYRITVYDSNPHAKLNIPVSGCPDPKPHQISLQYLNSDGYQEVDPEYLDLRFIPSNGVIKVTLSNIDKIVTRSITRFMLSAFNGVGASAHDDFIIEYVALRTTTHYSPTDVDSEGHSPEYEPAVHTGGLIAGVVIAVVVGTIICSIIYICWRRQRAIQRRIPNYPLTYPMTDSSTQQASNGGTNSISQTVTTSGPRTSYHAPTAPSERNDDSYQTSLPPPSYEAVSRSDGIINNNSAENSRPVGPPPSYESVQASQQVQPPPPYPAATSVPDT